MVRIKIQKVIKIQKPIMSKRQKVILILKRIKAKYIIFCKKHPFVTLVVRIVLGAFVSYIYLKYSIISLPDDLLLDDPFVEAAFPRDRRQNHGFSKEFFVRNYEPIFKVFFFYGIYVIWALLTYLEDKGFLKTKKNNKYL